MSEVTFKHWWGTPLVGLAGGYLASLVGWPLPYMVGSLLAIILVRCLTPWQLAEIPGGRKCGQWVVGIGIGLHFTPVVIEQVMSHFGLIFFGALITSASSVVGVWLMRRSGEDRATAFFSSMPGGSGEMVNLGARNGAVLSRVAAGQSLRVLMVVLCVPAAFKYLLGEGAPALHPASVNFYWLVLLFPAGALAAWIWQRLRQPNPWLFGPLLVSASVSILWDLHIGLPDGSSQAGQWLIGSGLGCHFNRAFFRRAPVVHWPHINRDGADDADRQPVRTRLEQPDSARSALNDPGDDARRNCRNEPDRRDPAVVGAVGHGLASDALAVRAVFGRTPVSLLGTATPGLNPSGWRQFPVDRGQPVLLKKLVGATEMTVTDKPSVSGKRRRMH